MKWGTDAAVDASTTYQNNMHSAPFLLVQTNCQDTIARVSRRANAMTRLIVDLHSAGETRQKVHTS
jgi:hypothetical protein